MSGREVVLDTETTGVDHRSGDRLVEVAAVELQNHIPTGRTFHRYVNPERAVPEDATAIHGLTTGFLADKPTFAQIAPDLIAFIAGAPLVIHNAPFDAGFLNMEFARLPALGFRALTGADVVDTLAMARRKHPGASNSLDALCDRYKVDRSRRTKHGALLDAQILAEVYVELLGGRQTGLALAPDPEPVSARPAEGEGGGSADRPFRSRITQAEIARHAALVATLGPNAVWGDYLAKVQP